MSGDATTCDTCGIGIPYGVTCYAVQTGTWQGPTGDPDNGKPTIKIQCADCYSGPALIRAPERGSEVSR